MGPDDLWLHMAASANAACGRLVRGLKQMPGTALQHEPEASIVFAEWTRAGHRRLNAAGAQYCLWNGTRDAGPDDEPLTARLVTDWSANEEAVDRFVEILKG